MKITVNPEVLSQVKSLIIYCFFSNELQICILIWVCVCELAMMISHNDLVNISDNSHLTSICPYLSLCEFPLKETVHPLPRSFFPLSSSSENSSLCFYHQIDVDGIWFDQVAQLVDKNCCAHLAEWGTGRVFFFLAETSWYYCWRIFCIISNTHMGTLNGEQEAQGLLYFYIICYISFQVLLMLK